MLDGCEISELIPSDWIGSSTGHEETRSTSGLSDRGALHDRCDVWLTATAARENVRDRQAGRLLPARRAHTTTVRGCLRGMTVTPESSFILLVAGFLSTVRSS